MDSGNEELTIMTKTKEKILFETNELVISLNTQVAVLNNSNNELKRTVETYMEKMDKHLDRMDERDANLDQRVTIMRNDLTKTEGRVDNLVEDVKELKGRSNFLDMVSMAFTAIVGTVMYFMFGRQP